jgi:hypothetical protein
MVVECFHCPKSDKKIRKIGRKNTRKTLEEEKQQSHTEEQGEEEEEDNFSFPDFTSIPLLYLHHHEREPQQLQLLQLPPKLLKLLPSLQLLSKLGRRRRRGEAKNKNKLLLSGHRSRVLSPYTSTTTATQCYYYRKERKSERRDSIQGTERR